jgi:hypothetical protein
MPKCKDIKKVMIIGSGTIIIGQACEFDYYTLKYLLLLLAVILVILYYAVRGEN